ncbi:uncharacterized protein LOC122859860 [Aphidius gifuensis]|uniref:uncharacterized protein LOC122859860 n=1 Tax=Aphidius gifuensis TaxID=684658 RepID=UPI001CDD2FCC|nr:uncharacterized protein LOC122859860 [Aphidius gifuensis]
MNNQANEVQMTDLLWYKTAEFIGFEVCAHHVGIPETALKLQVINFDIITSKSGNGLIEKRHGDLLPNTIRCAIIGGSNCGKTNALMSLIVDPNVIQTDWLQNFDLGTFICKDEQTRSSKPYLLRKPSEQNVHLTCQVITISETRSGIEKSIELKRWHIPKLSKSTIDDVCDESDDSNKSNGSEQEKQSRKIKKVQQTAAGYNAQQAITSKFKRINHRIYSSDEEDYENEFENPSETMQQRKKTKISPREVIDAHVKHAKKSQNTAEKSKFFSPLPTEQTNIFNPKITSSPKDKVGKGDMISPQEIFLNEDPLSLDYEECNENESKQSLEILNSSSTGNFLDAEKYAQYWKQKYDDLLKSKSFPITEKTGLKLIEILDRFVLIR